MGEQSLINRFVTAKLKNEEDARQGVVVEQSADSITIMCESGEQHKCEPKCTIVPLSNLWGDTRKFAKRMGVKE